MKRNGSGLAVAFLLAILLFPLCGWTVDAVEDGIQLLAKQVISQEARDKAADIVADCKADENVKTDYDKALWLHNWLIDNADYTEDIHASHEHNIYSADGVLLHGDGVCQSYAEAFELLLDLAGITDNYVVYTERMDPPHAWNLVKLDGEWCHIDCTWDDPLGGDEFHGYFGLNDEMMKRDHLWDTEQYPTANSTQNVYYIRQGYDTVSSPDAFSALMHALVAQTTHEAKITYVGTDPSFDIYTAFMEWCASNNWKYGCLWQSFSITGYSLKFTMKYDKPWKNPDTLIPVENAGFTLYGGDSEKYSSADYKGQKSVLLLFTVSQDSFFLKRLHSELPALTDAGVEVIVNLVDCETVDALQATNLSTTYPGIHFTYADEDVFSQQFGYIPFRAGNIWTPAVVIYNKEGNLTYYAMNAIPGFQYLMEKAAAAEASNTIVASGRLGTTVSWMLQQNRMLTVSGLAEGQQVCAATYDSTGAMLDVFLLTPSLPTATLGTDDASCKLFLFDANFRPQATAASVT